MFKWFKWYNQVDEYILSHANQLAYMKGALNTLGFTSVENTKFVDPNSLDRKPFALVKDHRELHSRLVEALARFEAFQKEMEPKGNYRDLFAMRETINTFRGEMEATRVRIANSTEAALIKRIDELEQKIRTLGYDYQALNRRMTDKEAHIFKRIDKLEKQITERIVEIDDEIMAVGTKVASPEDTKPKDDYVLTSAENVRARRRQSRRDAAREVTLATSRLNKYHEESEPPTELEDDNFVTVHGKGLLDRDITVEMEENFIEIEETASDIYDNPDVVMYEHPPESVTSQGLKAFDGYVHSTQTPDESATSKEPEGPTIRDAMRLERHERVRKQAAAVSKASMDARMFGYGVLKGRSDGSIEHVNLADIEIPVPNDGD